MRTLDDIRDEYEFLEGDERYRLLIELGRELEDMPAALKAWSHSLATGEPYSVEYRCRRHDGEWREDGTLHFLADSNAAITKGIIALVLSAVQDRAPATILATDIDAALAPFDLRAQLSSNRTQGIPNMIALIRATAERLAA